MRKKLPKILVTGGAGFIGSAFVRLLCKSRHPAVSDQRVPRLLRGLPLNKNIIVLDKLTYAGDLKRLEEVRGSFKFYRLDICAKKKLDEVVARERPQTIVHFAAESHVDRSIRNAAPFIRTNIQGTQNLLEAVRKYRIKKFVHISTDEIYGEIRRGRFWEDSPLRPNSPYAASKAAADLMVKAYIRTYGLPAIIVRPCNNYGPWQYPEKFIPLAILKILRNEKIPLYGRGQNIREWLYVDDCARAILQILKKGRLGEIYNVGSNLEMKNIAVAKAVLNILGTGQEGIQFVQDRPGHDLRYRIDSRKVRKNIGWQPKTVFADGLEATVKWCLQHKGWLLRKWKTVAPLYRLR